MATQEITFRGHVLRYCWGKATPPRRDLYLRTSLRVTNGCQLHYVQLAVKQGLKENEEWDQLGLAENKEETVVECKLTCTGEVHGLWNADSTTVWKATRSWEPDADTTLAQSTRANTKQVGLAQQ